MQLRQCHLVRRGSVPARANPPRTVQVLVAWPEWLDAHSGVLDPLAEEFTSRHPQLTVDWQPLPLTYDLGSPGEGQQIEELHSAGLLFDVMQLTTGLYLPPLHWRRRR